MSIQELSPAEIEALVGSRHAAAGIEYPPAGLQPYYHWLVRTLHLLAESSAGALRVARDDVGPMVVAIAPGRASIDNVPLAYAGGTVDLAPFDGDTALVWLCDGGGGAAAVDAASVGTGWPGVNHIKLAEVTLMDGQIVAILDRRFETVFRV
jgi:hypothetical protein